MGTIDIDAALGRLIDLAASDTNQARRAANFLLAWWDGESWGHFPVADLFAVDAAVAADMTTILTCLGQHGGAIYPDAFGRRDTMAALVARWRPERAAA